MTVITISRQFGSGGRKIAAQVAEKLNYQFFDKRFMAQIASDVGMSDNELVDFSEENYNTKSFLDRIRNLLGQSEIVAEISTRERDPDGRDVQIRRKLDELQAVDLVRGAVRAAYDKGNVVIVGRGAQVILKDEEDVFHVRVIAPMQTRIKRLETIEKFSLAQAVSIAHERDEANLEYMNRFFKEHPDNPQLYDLVLNTRTLTIDSAAQMIVDMVRKHQPVAV